MAAPVYQTIQFKIYVKKYSHGKGKSLGTNHPDGLRAESANTNRLLE